MYNKNKSLVIIFYLLVPFIFSSCKKFVEVGSPATQLNSDAVFNNDATALSAQLSTYAQMEADGLQYYMLAYTGWSSDELNNFSVNTNAADLYTNNLTPDNVYSAKLWNSLYKYIYQSNAVIEKVQQSVSISQPVREQLIGEAKFTRALFYFYLVNLFGEVPLVLTTDYVLNASLPRSHTQLVYEQMILDLTEASDKLSTDFLGNGNKPSTERVRPTKWAALALLSRVYLYMGNWSLSSATSTEIISNTQQFSLVSDLNKVFSKNSKEAIWQLMSVIPNFNSYAGGLLVRTTSPNETAISEQYLSQFQTGDNRRTSWVNKIIVGVKNYYYPYKYKVGQNVMPVSEYTMVLRLAEIYLNRAEALAEQNDLVGALSDLNTIRNRAGLPGLAMMSQAALIDSIQAERSVELFAEFGDRWINLKRTGKSTTILGLAKGADWTEGIDELYPIPQQEINRNVQLTQNAGY